MPEKERKEVKKMKKGMTKAYRCSETPPRGGSRAGFVWAKAPHSPGTPEKGAPIEGYRALGPPPERFFEQKGQKTTLAEMVNPP